MSAWRAMLLARARVETRDVFSYLRAQLLVGEGWLAVLSLALVSLASFVIAVSELGRWGPQPLLHYIRWYVELGSAFLVLGSMARLLEHVAPQRSLARLPYLAPLSQASLHGPPLAAATVANLVHFTVAMLPALIIIGIRSGAGSAFYLRLPLVAGAISLGAALLGALLAFPIALACTRLHRRWRGVAGSFSGMMGLPLPLLPLMWFLPHLVPPAPFPTGPVTPFSAAGEVLTAAVMNEPTVAGAYLAAIVFGLALAFCAVYGRVRVPLEAYAQRALHRVRRVSLRPLVLLRAELAARLPLFLVAGAATGVLAGYTFAPPAGPPPLLRLAVLIVWDLFAVFLVLPYTLVFASDVRPRLSGPLGHPVAFMLLRTSPYARSVYHLQLYLGLMARTTLQILLSVLVCGGVLGWGTEFRQLLRYLPLLFSTMVIPATVLWQAVDLLSFGPRGQAHGSWLVWYLVWMVAVLWLFLMSIGLLHATTIPVLVLRVVGLSVAHGAMAGAMLVWGVWRLERMDWL